MKSVRQRANLRMDGDDDDDNSLYGADSIGGGPGGSGGEEKDLNGKEGEGTGIHSHTDRPTIPQRHRLVDATERVAALGNDDDVDDVIPLNDVRFSLLSVIYLSHIQLLFRVFLYCHCFIIISSSSYRLLIIFLFS